MTSPFASCTVLAAFIALAPVGCTSSSREIDETRTAERMAAAEWQMRQFEQQPRSNPGYKKLVYPQPVEDPVRTGRDLEGRPAAD